MPNYTSSSSVTFSSNIANQVSVGANVAEILLFVLTLISVIIAFLAYRDNKKRKAKERAIDLAHYFQSSIIPVLTYLQYALQGTKANELMNSSFPRNQIQSFNVEELQNLSQNPDIVKDVDLLIQKIPIKNLTNAKLFTSKTAPEFAKNLTFFTKTVFLPTEIDSSFSPEEIDQLEKSFPKEVRQSIVHNSDIALRIEFSNILNDALNVLEWFSMNFISGVADEGVVYQSLHQLYLSAVYQLYYFISKSNDSCSEKYFTNITALFILWKDRKEKHINKETKISQECATKREKTIFRSRPL